MIRRLFLPVALAGLAVLAMARVSEAQSAGNVIVHENRMVEYTFAQSAVFVLDADAEADHPITLAELVVTRIGSGGATIAPVILTPTAHVSISVTINLQQMAPPAFSRLLYSWRLHDAEDNVFETRQEEFFYEDNRFQWQGLAITRTNTLPALEVHWTTGDRKQGEDALNAASAAIPEIERVIGVRLGSPASPPLRIYLYPNTEALQSALRLDGREWVGGHADVRMGTILLAVPPDGSDPVAIANGVPHELTHLAIYSRMLDGYPRVPPWLNEGLATLLEPRQDPSLEQAIADAAAAGRLEPISELCAPFSADRQTAVLEYAESESLVRYIANRYGVATLQKLLDAYAQRTEVSPQACAGVIQQVLYVDSLERLQNDWQADLLRPSSGGQTLQAVGPWVLLTAAILIVPLFLLKRNRVRFS